jgi:hypothetical protein
MFPAYIGTKRPFLSLWLGWSNEINFFLCPDAVDLQNALIPSPDMNAMLQSFIDKYGIVKSSRSPTTAIDVVKT